MYLRVCVRGCVRACVRENPRSKASNLRLGLCGTGIKHGASSPALPKRLIYTEYKKTINGRHTYNTYYVLSRPPPIPPPSPSKLASLSPPPPRHPYPPDIETAQLDPKILPTDPEKP